MKEHNIEYIDIPFLDYKETAYPDHAIGCYVNYLEIGKLIILLVFEVPGNEDLEVVELFHQVFPDRHIETINFNAVGHFGGLLNCVSWNIFRPDRERL